MRQSVSERGSATAAGLDGTVDLARDRELVERCQRGDQAAFGELYSRYQRRLFRFCLRRLHEPNDAEEAVQESFTKAWRALPRFGGERRFYPWLSVIASNVCTDVLRRRSRLVPMDDLPLPTADLSSEDVDAALVRQVDLAMATEALTHLSERHQRVLRLREADGWSTQRIAEQEGVAVPAVDTLLWRARQAFKREFVALTESSGQLAAMAGLSLLALRRFALRHLSRISARVVARLPLPSPPAVRSHGVLAASAALTGVALAGGGLAIANAGGTHPPTLPAPNASAGTVESAAAPSRPGSGTATGQSPATLPRAGGTTGAGASPAASGMGAIAAGGQPPSSLTNGGSPDGIVPASPMLPGGASSSGLGSTVNNVVGTGSSIVDSATTALGLGPLLNSSTSSTTTSTTDGSPVSQTLQTLGKTVTTLTGSVLGGS